MCAAEARATNGAEGARTPDLRLAGRTQVCVFMIKTLDMNVFQCCEKVQYSGGSTVNIEENIVSFGKYDFDIISNQAAIDRGMIPQCNIINTMLKVAENRKHTLLRVKI